MEPRGLRNNNPGNIRYNVRTEWQGEVRGTQKKDKEFCEFITVAYGYRALILTLQNYRRLHGLKTISQMIRRWAPEHENSTSSYVNFVAGYMRKEQTAIVNIDSKEDMCRMAAAISQMENGRQAVMVDVEAGWNLL